MNRTASPTWCVTSSRRPNHILLGRPQSSLDLQPFLLIPVEQSYRDWFSADSWRFQEILGEWRSSAPRSAHASVSVSGPVVSQAVVRGPGRHENVLALMGKGQAGKSRRQDAVRRAEESLPHLPVERYPRALPPQTDDVVALQDGDAAGQCGVHSCAAADAADPVTGSARVKVIDSTIAPSRRLPRSQSGRAPSDSTWMVTSAGLARPLACSLAART